MDCELLKEILEFRELFSISNIFQLNISNTELLIMVNILDIESCNLSMLNKILKINKSKLSRYLFHLFTLKFISFNEKEQNIDRRYKSYFLTNIGYKYLHEISIKFESEFSNHFLNDTQKETFSFILKKILNELGEVKNN